MSVAMLTYLLCGLTTAASAMALAAVHLAHHHWLRRERAAARHRHPSSLVRHLEQQLVDDAGISDALRDFEAAARRERAS